ncbi:MAG: hypothetical protein QOK37_1167 [Thermoanaerobaculia bacterium]|jgi:hypothetical protein|nr:hypothetical protein [Thermoanaerobaculia bacterium]
MAWRNAMSAKEALMWDINHGMSVTMAAEVHGMTRSCASGCTNEDIEDTNRGHPRNRHRI